MAQINSIENDSSEKTGHTDYGSFSNERVRDCLIIDAHLRALQALAAEIQDNVHDFAPMPVKDDVSSVSFLLQAARDKVNTLYAEMDRSSSKYEEKSALTAGA